MQIEMYFRGFKVTENANESVSFWERGNLVLCLDISLLIHKLKVS